MINGQPLVPAMFIFGDSVVDAGNNNYIYTIVKANFRPYGRDFVHHKPTGRFCNGKLAADFTGTLFLTIFSLQPILFFDSLMVLALLILSKTAENIGFTSYPPAYLSEEAKGKNLLIGANFASGASGYYETTAKLYVRTSYNHIRNLSLFLSIYSFFYYVLLILVLVACNPIESAA